MQSAKQATPADAGVKSWALWVSAPDATPGTQYLAIAVDGRMFRDHREVETDAEAREALVAFVHHAGISLGIDTTAAVQHREIERLRARVADLEAQIAAE